MTQKKDIVKVEMTNAFAQAVIPEKITKPSDMFLFQCPKCKNVHFRHAGYVEALMSFVRADKEKNVANDSLTVMVCTKCKACYLWYNEKMKDITSLIDLEAWEKTEKDLHAATGPGGEC
jgi:hypothetical protein